MKYIITALFLAISVPAISSEKVSAIPAKSVPANLKKGDKPAFQSASCNDFKETVSLSVSFNFPVDSFTAAKVKFDEKMKQVENFAKQQKISQFEIQSMSYNINSRGYNGHSEEKRYQFTANMNYKLDSFDDGVKLAEFLDKEKFQVNLSSNSSRQGYCNR